VAKVILVADPLPLKLIQILRLFMLKAKSANQMWHKHYFWKKGWPHPQLFVAAPQKL